VVELDGTVISKEPLYPEGEAPDTTTASPVE
jgi:hypothetical protein